MSILNYNDKLFFMFDAIRRLIFGMTAVATSKDHQFLLNQ